MRPDRVLDAVELLAVPLDGPVAPLRRQAAALIFDRLRLLDLLGRLPCTRQSEQQVRRPRAIGWRKFDPCIVVVLHPAFEGLMQRSAAFTQGLLGGEKLL